MLVILFTIKIDDSHDLSDDSTPTIFSYSPNDHIDPSQLITAQRGVCFLQDRPRSSRLWGTIKCVMLRLVAMHCDLIR